MIKKATDYFGKMKFKSKLFTINFAVVLFATLTLFISFIIITSNHLKNYSISNAKQNVELASIQMEDELDNINLWSMTISRDAVLSNIFLEGIDLKNIYDTNDKVSYIESYTRSFGNSNVSGIYLYLNSRKNFKGNFFSDLSVAYETEWYKIMEKRDITTYWYLSIKEKTGIPTLSLIRLIKNRLDDSKTIGIIKIDCNETLLTNILNEETLYFNNICYLVSADNNNIYPLTNVTGLNKLDKNEKEFFINSKNTWNFYETNGNKYYVNCRKLLNTNLYLVNVIVWEEMEKLLKKILPLFFIFLTLILIVSYTTASLFSGSVSRRISDLAFNLKTAGIKYLPNNTMPENNTKDDISIIIDKCEGMISQIDKLYARQFEDGQKLKEAEYKILYEQINPHFLYNTLNLIKYLSEKENNHRLTTVIDALSGFYKTGLNNGEDIITIKNELEHIRCYTEIQNVRFSNKIKLSVNVPDEILNCYTVKLILQPLVENAISHGILPKPDKMGEIEITGYFENNDVILNVFDDGMGIAPDKLDTLLSENSENFGLKNIHSRIKLCFGEDYGINIESKHKKYTLIKIKLPKITKHTEDNRNDNPIDC